MNNSKINNRKKKKFYIDKISTQERELDISIKFYDFAFTSIATTNFTNFLKDKQEWMGKYKKIFGELIPEIQGKKLSEIQSNKNYHFHKIDESIQIKLCLRIIRELYKKQNHLKSFQSYHEEYLKQKFFDTELYQIGINAIDCTRLVFIINNSTLEVVFFDMHHLIYANKKYNDKDYQNYKFSPILELEVK